MGPNIDPPGVACVPYPRTTTTDMTDRTARASRKPRGDRARRPAPESSADSPVKLLPFRGRYVGASGGAVVCRCGIACLRRGPRPRQIVPYLFSRSRPTRRRGDHAHDPAPTRPRPQTHRRTSPGTGVASRDRPPTARARADAHYKKSPLGIRLARAVRSVISVVVVHTRPLVGDTRHAGRVDVRPHPGGTLSLVFRDDAPPRAQPVDAEQKHDRGPGNAQKEDGKRHGRLAFDERLIRPHADHDRHRERGNRFDKP